MDHSDVISVLASSCGVNKYLELGVYVGETLNKVSRFVPKCIGVDVVKHTLVNPNLDVRIQTTKDFFSTNTETFDMIFIDADHSFESAKQDFLMSVDHLSKDGIILLHDTNPSSASLLPSGYCGDSYKMIDWLRETGIYNSVTIPVTDPGLTIVTQLSCERFRNFV